MDAKDRLIWIERNKDKNTAVLVSKENEDLVEAMDFDGDGNIEVWEMEGFYNNYDLNKNGILEEEEIEAAED